jgi:DNA-binding NarL/FixJ family response regulator
MATNLSIDHAPRSQNNNKQPIELSEGDNDGLVAVGLTDHEIATQLHIAEHELSNRIARLLARLEAQERLEIVLRV